MIYFDNAATTFPKPIEVYDKINEVMRQCANPGRSGHEMSRKTSQYIFETRKKIYKLFNAPSPMNVIFTYNATDSLNIAIKGSLKPGDHVITTSMEHNSVLRPLSGLEELGIEVSIVFCENGNLDKKDIENLIKENTKLVICTHVSNVIGNIMPIKEIGQICKKNSLTFLVDAAQSAGILDINMKTMNIDILVFTGHKHLLGPQGIGGFCIGEGIQLKSYREGGTGSKSELLKQPDILPDKFESGTPNTIGIAGLGAGIDFISKTGIDEIRKKEATILKTIEIGLKSIKSTKTYNVDEKNRTGIISFNIINNDSRDVAYTLNKDYDIACRGGLHCAPLAHKSIGTYKQGVVRISTSYFNSLNEVDYLIESIKKI